MSGYASLVDIQVGTAGGDCVYTQHSLCGKYLVECDVQQVASTTPAPSLCHS